VNFARVLKEVLWCLVTEGSISYRRIKRGFGLDDDALEDVRGNRRTLLRGRDLRLEGNLLLDENGSAEACYVKALDVARAQEAPSLELRAAGDLARLWAGHLA
jgi:hypothetical protein